MSLKGFYASIRYRGRRKFARYKLKTKVSMGLGPYPHDVEKTKIIDIGMGGLAFVYHGKTEDVRQLHKICILIGDKSLMEMVPCRFVSDTNLEDKSKRRISMKFRWLTDSAKDELNSIISKYSG